MKIVLAEKVSPATLAVFAAEPGWEVKTHDQLPDGLAGGACRCRRAGGAQRRAGGRRADGARAQAARDWPRRRGRGQHRRRSRHAPRHCGDEHAGRERRGRGRADHRPDDRAGAQGACGECHHARRQVGEEKSAGLGAARQDAGHSRPGAHRARSGAARARLRHGDHRQPIRLSPQPWRARTALRWFPWKSSLRRPTISRCTWASRRRPTASSTPRLSPP